MKCDALESATYSRFAAHARMDSDWELARVFQESADSDRTEHFAKEAALEGLIKESPENLRNAIDRETRQSLMYKQFALEATRDSDLSVAAEFESICSEKEVRCARLEALLADMGLHSRVRTIGE